MGSIRITDFQCFISINVPQILLAPLFKVCIVKSDSSLEFKAFCNWPHLLF